MSQHRPDPIARSNALTDVRQLAAESLEWRSTTQYAIEDALEGKQLASGVTAKQDIPARSHATMDGYAIDATESYPFRVRDAEIFPEDTASELGPGEAVSVATGAPIPSSANAVIKIEEVTVTDGQLTGPPVSPGTYVYERASNVRTGEQLFEPGERLSAKDTILLRDLGYESVECYEPLSVGLLATGSEIHEGKTDDFDSPMLASLIRSWGHAPAFEGTVPDEYERVRSTVDSLATEHDVVMTTGGTSVGKKDYAVRALSDLGEVVFHRVALRPGKPIAAARLPDHDAVAFAIPGKPIGAHAVTTLVCRPFFTGETRLPTVSARASVSVAVPTPGFEYVIPVMLDGDEALALGHRDSPVSIYAETFDPSVLSSTTRVSRADGFVLTETGFETGETVSVVPYEVVE